MSTTQLVALQAPIDVSLEEIDAKLQEIWQGENASGEAISYTRASTFTMVIYEPDGTQVLMAGLGFYQGPIDGIAGPRTQAAIKAAQKAYGFEVTGKSNPQFRDKLRAEYQAMEANEMPAHNRHQYSPDVEGSVIADTIAEANPCRIITLCPTVGEDQGVSAQVSAYCPIHKRSQHNAIVCCEYITLTGTAEALERIGGIVEELLIPELPKFIWWKASLDLDYGLLTRLSKVSTSCIIDSSNFINPELDLSQVAQFIQANLPIIDLNWARLAPWQELAAESFDPPERRNAIFEVDQVTIDYEKGNCTQAIMYLSWLASRLNWMPISFVREGGDYEIMRFKFNTTDKREVNAELAAIPIADWGDILGDLVSLKLMSTNPNANCCTILCSETMGCMRLEAKGGAQACHVRQVTPILEQKTEVLLSKKLQTWGSDNLYQEIMAVVDQILSLAQ